VMKA